MVLEPTDRILHVRVIIIYNIFFSPPHFSKHSYLVLSPALQCPGIVVERKTQGGISVQYLMDWVCMEKDNELIDQYHQQCIDLLTCCYCSCQ